MSNFIRICLAAFTITALSITALPYASAGGPVIEKAQRDGLVGERIDGYLGVVDQSADSDIKRRVNEINAQRRTLYGQLARQEGVPIETVARLTGEKQIARAPSGSFVMRENGGWTRK
ncbi:MAG: YdbL family protein [Pseudomonadota bacterium]